MTKKRIIVLATIAVGITALIYTISASTKNFALLALSPLTLGFLACPLMCAGMGGVLWLAGRPSRNKEKGNFQKNSGGCCCQQHNDNVPENHNTNCINNDKKSIDKSADFETIINSDGNFNPPHSKSEFKNNT